MTVQELTIGKKKYVLLPAEEFANMQQDITDLKKVFSRTKESGVEANEFFKTLATKKKLSKI